MALFDIFRKDKRKNPVYKFSDEDTEKSHISRQENLIKKKYNEIQLQRLEHLQSLLQERQMNEKIAMMEQELYNEDEDEEESNIKTDPLDTVFNSFVGMIANKMQSPQSQNGTTSFTATSQPAVTEDTIKQTIDTIPKVNIEQLQKLSTEELTELIMQKFPQLNSEQVVFAIGYIKAKVFK